MTKETKSILLFFEGNALKNAYQLGTRQFFSSSADKSPYGKKISFFTVRSAEEIEKGFKKMKSFFAFTDFKEEEEKYLSLLSRFPEGSAVSLSFKGSEKEQITDLLSRTGFRICESFSATKVAESFFKKKLTEEEVFYCLAVRKRDV